MHCSAGSLVTTKRCRHRLPSDVEDLPNAGVPCRYQAPPSRPSALADPLPARLDHRYDTDLRRLIAGNVLIVDGFALRGRDPGRYRRLPRDRGRKAPRESHLEKAAVITSNRDPNERPTALADPLSARSAIDRLQSAAGDSLSRANPPDAGEGPS